jgi:hypothetical protein
MAASPGLARPGSSWRNLRGQEDAWPPPWSWARPGARDRRSKLAASLLGSGRARATRAHAIALLPAVTARFGLRPAAAAGQPSRRSGPDGSPRLVSETASEGCGEPASGRGQRAPRVAAWRGSTDASPFRAPPGGQRSQRESARPRAREDEHPRRYFAGRASSWPGPRRPRNRVKSSRAGVRLRLVLCRGRRRWPDRDDRGSSVRVDDERPQETSPCSA